jgi:hypothetical protein
MHHPAARFARRLLADLAELAALSLLVAAILLWAALLSGPST